MRPLFAELSPVTDFREACCRQHETDACERGGFCNFMHVRRPNKRLLKDLQHELAVEIRERKRKEKEAKSASSKGRGWKQEVGSGVGAGEGDWRKGDRSGDWRSAHAEVDDRRRSLSPKRES